MCPGLSILGYRSNTAAQHGDCVKVIGRESKCEITINKYNNRHLNEHLNFYAGFIDFCRTNRGSGLDPEPSAIPHAT